MKRLIEWSETNPTAEVRLTGAGWTRTGYISAEHSIEANGKASTRLRVCWSTRHRRNYASIFPRHLNPDPDSPIRLEIKGANGRYIPAWESIGGRR